MSRHDQELNQEGYIMQTKQKCFQAVYSFFFYPQLIKLQAAKPTGCSNLVTVICVK